MQKSAAFSLDGVSSDFFSPGQEVLFHDGAVARVGEILDALEAADVLFVVDSPSYRQSGAAAVLEPHLERRRCIKFCDFEPNPKIEDIDRGVELFRQSRPDAVVALGGGSAIDLAKIIRTCGVHAAAPIDFIGKQRAVVQPGPPLIAVPTTAGTGSEATHFAVAYIHGVKFSLAHADLLPKFAVLDPELTLSLPARITAASGLDAICQAIESIWSIGATQQSLQYATRAATMALAHLVDATHRPTLESRREMLAAAHLAGKAINITKTTAPHAASYAITARHGVPHGFAVAMTLGAFLEFNSRVDDASCLDRRGAGHVQERIKLIIGLLGAHSVDEACANWQSLLHAVGCPTRLGEVGIVDREIDELLRQVNAERIANNPRRATSDSIRNIYFSMM